MNLWGIKQTSELRKTNHWNPSLFQKLKEGKTSHELISQAAHHKENLETNWQCWTRFLFVVNIECTILARQIINGCASELMPTHFISEWRWLEIISVIFVIQNNNTWKEKITKTFMSQQPTNNQKNIDTILFQKWEYFQSLHPRNTLTASTNVTFSPIKTPALTQQVSAS